MERRTFIQALVVALLLLVGLNFAVGWLGRNAVPRVIVRQIHDAPAITHLFLGDSLVQAGFIPTEFTRVAARFGVVAKPLNAGLGWSTVAEHAVLWEEVRERGHHPKKVFYGFFDFQLHDQLHGDPWWKLAGNISMAYYVNPGVASRYHAPGSLAGRVFMEAARYVPLFTERSTFWGKVEQTRRGLGALGIAPAAQSGEAPPDAFRAFESGNSETFERRSREIVRDDTPFVPALRDLIQSVREEGGELWLIEMPMPPTHQQAFYAQPGWTAYKDHLRKRLRAEGVAFVEAGSWVSNPASFADSLHLNHPGAQRFTELLATHLFAQKPRPLVP